MEGGGYKEITSKALSLRFLERQNPRSLTEKEEENVISADPNLSLTDAIQALNLIWFHC